LFETDTARPEEVSLLLFNVILCIGGLTCLESLHSFLQKSIQN
jgi:hypothetical protein